MTIAMSLLVLGLTAACSSTPDTAKTADHNAADITFAQDMIPHHAQAVQMSTMAAGSATNTEVKALAATIQAAQEPEITTMTGWLKTWKEDVPSADMGGMDHSGGSMPGMLDQQQMDGLEQESGAAFDKMFLKLMRAHHTGAIEMATTEQQSGKYQPAKDLAGQIIKDQTAEITKIDALLKTL